jgi:hypothetical protein
LRCSDPKITRHARKFPQDVEQNPLGREDRF